MGAAWALRRDREVVLTAVGSNGFALQYATEDLKADFEVALTAVQNDALAVRFAHASLRVDPCFRHFSAAGPGTLSWQGNTTSMRSELVERHPANLRICAGCKDLKAIEVKIKESWFCSACWYQMRAR